MIHIKLFESYNKRGIASLDDNDDAQDILGVHFNRDNPSKEIDIQNRWVNLITQLFKDNNIPFEIVETGKINETAKFLAIHFTTPKEFDQNPGYHQYNPSNIYYTIRIYEHEDEYFLFQWFSSVYATEQHLQNYYKKHPHSGPGGKNYKYHSQITGKEELCYQPPLYKGYDDRGGDGQGGWLVCDQFDSLKRLLLEFIKFLNNKNDWGFFPEYPKYQVGMFK